MNTVVVSHPRGSYPVNVGMDMGEELARSIAAMNGRAVIIADATVSRLHPALLPGIERITFPAGEASKNLTTWSALSDQLLQNQRVDRQAVIVALGGGVTTDLAGFVAATTLRGLRWVAVPTTTLAMLDAAIGGKTGVDTASGKNLIGAFHQPSSVWCDVKLSGTLDDMQFKAGLAELIKHAAIADGELWQWLADSAELILARDPAAMVTMLTRSAAIKAAVVGSDERESGRRAILNFGHTVAHAIEHATAFAVPHGHAVAIGMVAETLETERLGITRNGTAGALTALLRRFGLPVAPPAALDPALLAEALHGDKKNRNGEVHIAPISAVGTPAGSAESGWTTAIDSRELIAKLTA